MNTIDRALKSIEDDYSGTREWPPIGAKVNRKAVILASGFQDDTYADYISTVWSLIRVEEFPVGYSTWRYNRNFGTRATSADCGRIDTTPARSRSAAPTRWWHD